MLTREFLILANERGTKVERGKTFLFIKGNSEVIFQY